MNTNNGTQQDSTLCKADNTPMTDCELASNPHYHKDQRGALRICYHKCKSVFSDLGFWIGLTIGFPIEHLLWEKVPPFSFITSWLHSL